MQAAGQHSRSSARAPLYAHNPEPRTPRPRRPQGVPCIAEWTPAALRQLSTLEFHQLRLVLEEFGARSAVAQVCVGCV